MKTTIKNRRTLAIVLSVAFLFTICNFTLANEGNRDTLAVELKHIGNIRNQPVFQLDVANFEKDEYTITITDETGVILYIAKIKGATRISKKFQVNTDEIEGNLRFEVKARKNKKAEVFEVNSQLRYVNETSISKL